MSKLKNAKRYRPNRLRSSTLDSGGFQYVEQRSTKKNRKRRNNGKHKATLDLVNRAPPDLHLQLQTRRSVMEKSRWLSLSLAWFTQCLNDPKGPSPPRKIVCLALGSFSPDTAQQPVLSPVVASCTGIHGLKQSQYQLVFLLDVILPILSARHQSEKNQGYQAASPIDLPQRSNLKVCFFDPAFTGSDKENLRKMGYNVLDAEPSLCCEESTFFYMPHAPKTLYERLVCENSTPSHRGDLSHIVLVGNDLKSYQKIMVQEEKDSIPALMHLDPRMIHTHYPPDLTKLNQDTGVHFFNETCFQWFTKP